MTLGSVIKQHSNLISPGVLKGTAYGTAAALGFFGLSVQVNRHAQEISNELRMADDDDQHNQGLMHMAFGIAFLYITISLAPFIILAGAAFGYLFEKNNITDYKKEDDHEYIAYNNKV